MEQNKEKCMFCEKQATKNAYIMAVVPKPLCDEHYEKHYITTEMQGEFLVHVVKIK